jgi:homoserine dehydrogenase
MIGRVTKTKPVLVLQLGLGRVGRALIGHYLARAGRYPNLRYVGVGDHGGLWLIPDGWDGASLAEAAAFKDSGMPVTRWCPEARGAEAVPSPDAYAPDLLWRLDEIGVRRAIVVDTTAPGSGTAPLLLELHRAGYDLVLANAAPLAGAQADWDAVMLRGRGRVRLEAALGGGLPLVEILRRAAVGGPAVGAITAALHPGLNSILAAVVRGARFSAAVGDAQASGLLHGDLTEDLGGRTVARQALILARLLGARLEPEAVEVASLLPESWAGVPPWTLMGRLHELDPLFADQAWRAGERGERWCYLAHAGAEGARTTLETQPLGGPFGRLRDDETLAAFYAPGESRPALMQAPGPAAAATAAILFADIVSLL